ncbi:MAG: metallophosphoesterase [Kordiimonadaceae bacterium]|nr:metallophosphoesterase [Kordiimonadaceae bacterium]
MARESAKVFHRHLGPNTIGRDFYLGDLHGRLDLLILAMGKTDYNPKRDRIIAVGDLIDRGRNSYEILKLTREHWFHSVRGNHETMLLDANDDRSLGLWLANGGDWFMDVGGEAIVDSFALALELPTALTVEAPDGSVIGVCHAEWPGDDWAKVEEALEDPILASTMIWGRNYIKNNTKRWDKTAALTIHGHSFVEEATKLGTSFFIDTGCVFDGKLTMIDREEALNWPDSP